MVQHPEIPILAALCYGAFIFFGQRYFMNKNPWDWRRTMALWDLSLSVFSAIGFLRTAPHLIHNFSHYTLRENFCFDPESHFGSGATGMWVQLFVLSKIPELFDTFFIVIHKRPLIFLHWYHHVSVLFCCWNAYVTKSPIGLITIVMNYGVHAIMYFYYFLIAVKSKPKFFNAVYITIAQIAQMFVGVIAMAYAWYLILWGTTETEKKTCWVKKENTFFYLIVYGSYLFLFLQFFFQRYQSRNWTYLKVKKQV
jgi:elongation of very long chain fatty acids protein 6